MEATINFNHLERVRNEVDQTLDAVLKVVEDKIKVEHTHKPDPIKRKWRKDFQPPSIAEKFTDEEYQHYVENGVDSHEIADMLGTEMMRLIDMRVATRELRKRLRNGFNEAIHIRAISITLTQDDITYIGHARTWLEPTS